MSLSALAAQAGVAKSTVSLIERGRGNPSLETISSLASALEVPFAALLTDDAPAGEVALVRERDATVVEAVQGEGGDILIRHMLTRVGAGPIEIHTLELARGATRRSKAAVKPLIEHIVVCAGAVELAGAGFSEVVGPGDLISLRADEPYSCTVIDGPARLISVREHPRERQLPR